MIKVYNQQMQLVAFLENAFDISYEMPFNSVWTASFSLPATDEKNAECQSFHYVELYDDNERIELFRIIKSTASRSIEKAVIKYECEHALATLIDDVLFLYHEVGNIGTYSRATIQYILSKQTIHRWSLGIVDFTRQFEYTWENDNLLAALLSVPKPFDEEYMWTWDTTVYPWTINLVKPPQGVDAYIRYAVNMQGVTRQKDDTTLCTRLYCLGYGEGVNQLTIADANNGLPYIDSDTQAEYGIVNKLFVDRRFQYPDTLLARGQAVLNAAKHPKITYEVDASELYSITKDPIDKFKTGVQVRVIDEDLGIDIISRVLKVSKGNMLGAPGEVTLEIANHVQDVSGSIADLSDRQRVSETNSQGSTNIDTHVFSDNCDPSHPAKLRFWVPEEAVRINKVMLSYRADPFRSYSKAIEGGGAYSSSITSNSGGGSIITSGDSGIDVSYGYGWTEESDGHRHLFQEVRGHKHNISLPNHTHKVDVLIPDHVHGIQFGIYEGATATALGLFVDGNLVPGSAVSVDEFDIIPYLSKDDSGRVQRGQWHTIELVPNLLSRIECAVIVQLFIQSRGGVDA
ncbi:MAG: phage tail protein [Candidatus Pristimantibacillus lignocellulolyticus]|uniref:Phage tail protein n=1 Tax=Candidatus Pristimantibacillus lignocellulolyticus TaxID=2994561 RepID=A0A9J6ZEU1_9BACL|nr:MAG: phage tail protein [Candidatus Pristimantibacillus lignocellulolyticus]